MPPFFLSFISHLFNFSTQAKNSLFSEIFIFPSSPSNCQPHKSGVPHHTPSPSSSLKSHPMRWSSKQKKREELCLLWSPPKSGMPPAERSCSFSLVVHRGARHRHNHHYQHQPESNKSWAGTSTGNSFHFRCVFWTIMQTHFCFVCL